MLHKFKIFDLVGQLLCLMVPIILGAYFDNGRYYVLTYFTVGGWQLISFLISAATMKAEEKAAARKIYGVLLLCTLGSALLLLTGWDPAFLLLYVYLFFTPLMAIMYFIITARESSIAESNIKRNEFVQKR
ncbi:MAG: hypothetical protein R2800_05315 [Flavipsychrobacter sp.]